MGDPHLVRPATPADRDAVLALVGEMWGRDVAERYEWLYQRNPHGQALTWLAEEVSGARSVVAVTSVFPRVTWVAGEQRLGAIGGDCYVAPRARRRSLATRLHQATFTSMRELGGVAFMMGPPRPHNLAALLKAGSHEVTVFRRWRRPLTADAAAGMLARRFSRLPYGAGAPLASAAGRALRRLVEESPRAGSATLEPLASAPRDGALLAAITRSHGDRIVPVRDAEWIAWRYFQGPSRTQRVHALRVRGELAGYVVLEVDGARVVLVDVALPPDAAILDAALDAVMVRARELGGETLDANFTAEAPIVARLRRRGFFGRESHGFQVALAEGERDIARAGLLGRPWTFSEGDKDRDTSFTEEEP